MSAPPTVRPSAPRRYTSAALTVGVGFSALCFAIAALAEVVGVQAEVGEVTDVGAVIEGLGVLSPWAWATLGVYAIVLTPAVGLLVTIGEYASASERRAALLALTVLAILTISAAVAIALPAV